MTKNTAIAKAYYTAMSEKNIKVMEKYLHPDVELISPLSQLRGKEAYLEALKGFTSFFETLTIRAVFGEGDQAVVICDVECPPSIGILPTAILMTLRDELITRLELFHDTAPLHKAKNDLLA